MISILELSCIIKQHHPKTARSCITGKYSAVVLTREDSHITRKSKSSECVNKGIRLGFLNKAYPTALTYRNFVAFSKISLRRVLGYLSRRNLFFFGFLCFLSFLFAFVLFFYCSSFKRLLAFIWIYAILPSLYLMCMVTGNFYDYIPIRRGLFNKKKSVLLHVLPTRKRFELSNLLKTEKSPKRKVVKTQTLESGLQSKKFLKRKLLRTVSKVKRFELATFENGLQNKQF